MELGEGVVSPAERLESNGVIVVAPGVRVRRRKFLLEAFPGLLKPIETQIGSTQIEINFRVLRRDGKSATEEFDGIAKLKLGLVENAEALQDFGVVGSERQSLVVAALGAGVVLGLLVGARPVKKRLHVLRGGEKTRAGQADEAEGMAETRLSGVTNGGIKHTWVS